MTRFQTAIVNVFMDSNLIVARMRRCAPRSCEPRICEPYTEGSMQRDFLCAPLAKLGTPVCRIGLSATYRPGRETVHKALDEGLNYFQYFGFDRQMTVSADIKHQHSSRDGPQKSSLGDSTRHTNT